MVNFSNYVESHDFLDTLTQDDDISFNPNPHQDSQKSDSESEDEATTSDLSNKQEAFSVRFMEETPLKTNDKRISQPLKRFSVQLDHNVSASIITPQTKTATKPSTIHEAAHPETARGLQSHNNPKTTDTARIGTTPTFGSKQDSNNKVTKNYYSSPFLDKEFKPASDSFDLNLDLEILRPLIMSQHEVFIQPIKDLGNINLFLTKIIEKKKQSLTLLQAEQKIPRSLRIKCELTTSPSYASNQDFIRLKEEMQDTVATFIKKGTTIMTEWANVNIKLLTFDRGSNFLSKAIKILEGLSSFYLEVIGTPKWKSLPSDKYIPLFLFKLYFSGEYITVDDLIEYFDLPLKEILFIGARNLTDATTTEEFELILDAINFADINPDDPIHESFIIETLTSFDQIMKTTTIEIWSHYKDRVKQITAAQNLKARMRSKETSDITAATSLAIAKATEDINSANTQHLTSILRINNLEKSTRVQQQKTNEIINALKAKRAQKNYNGSYKKGSVTSPSKQTLKTGSGNKHKIIDLSKEEPEHLESHPSLQQNTQTLQNFEDLGSPPNQRYKRQKKGKTQQAYQTKKVQWQNQELAHTNQAYTDTLTATHTQQPPVFQPAPAPSFFQQQQYPVYSHYQLNPFGTNFAPQTQPLLTSQMVPPNTFQPQLQQQLFNQGQNPFVMNNRGRHIPSRENPFGTMTSQNHN